MMTFTPSWPHDILLIMLILTARVNYTAIDYVVTRKMPYVCSPEAWGRLSFRRRALSGNCRAVETWSNYFSPCLTEDLSREEAGLCLGLKVLPVIFGKEEKDLLPNTHTLGRRKIDGTQATAENGTLENSIVYWRTHVEAVEGMWVGDPTRTYYVSESHILLEPSDSGNL